MPGLTSLGKTATGSTGGPVLQQFLIADGYGTALGNGDPVSVNAASGTLIQCPETARPIGVLRGIRYVDATGSVQYLNSFPAGTTNTGNIEGFTDVVALVEPIDGVSFIATTSGRAMTQADVGATFRLASLGRSASTGLSTATIGLNLSVTTENRKVKILAVYPTPGNVIGTGTIVECVVV